MLVAGIHFLLKPLFLNKILKLIRFPNLVMIALCQLLVEVCLIHAGQSLSTILQNERFYLLLYATFCISAAGYIINDYYDIKIDAINKPSQQVVGRSINRRQAMLAHLLLSGFGIVVGGAINWKVGLINAGAVLLLWGYSDRLKKTLLAGNITIAFLSATMLLVVGVNAGITTRALYAYALFAFLISLIREIIKDLEDIKGDAAFDCRTLPIVAGLIKTKWVIYILFAGFYLTIISAMLYRHADMWFNGYMLLLIILPSLFVLYKITTADRRRHFKKISRWCKIIMLLGMLSMLLFRYL